LAGDENTAPFRRGAADPGETLIMDPIDAPLKCPGCGEPVQRNWKLCPLCERPLGAGACPRCGAPVEARWKRCPQCTARLVCADCGRRIPAGREECPDCRGASEAASAAGSDLIEPATGMEFVRVPGGGFEMGDLFGDGWENETPVHTVRLDGFFMGRYPVTQGQWERLMGDNPSRFRRGADYPVEQVAWREVEAFIRRLNGAGDGRGRFRLPTEAEWEYAARSGGRRELYAGGDHAAAVAWYDENSEGATHPVGQKKPNGLGLCDMSGNVWEWCRDVYSADAYHRHAAENPLAAGEGGDQVIRGGSWNLDAWSARCSRRSSMDRDFAGPGLGFRLVQPDGSWPGRRESGRGPGIRNP
jgi:formylglycine-generating enzyme required for sulfatase activity